VNEGVNSLNVGIDPHPSHTGTKEISNGQFVLPVNRYEEATSTLTTKGEHAYHDHNNPGAKGVIVVQ
jgi:plastocyanin